MDSLVDSLLDDFFWLGGFSAAVEAVALSEISLVEVLRADFGELTRSFSWQPSTTNGVMLTIEPAVVVSGVIALTSHSAVQRFLTQASTKSVDINV